MFLSWEPGSSYNFSDFLSSLINSLVTKPLNWSQSRQVNWLWTEKDAGSWRVTYLGHHFTCKVNLQLCSWALLNFGLWYLHILLEPAYLHMWNKIKTLTYPNGMVLRRSKLFQDKGRHKALWMHCQSGTLCSLWTMCHWPYFMDVNTTSQKVQMSLSKLDIWSVT